MATAVIPVTGTLVRPDGSASTDVTLTFYPVTELGASWTADAVVVEELTVTPDDTGAVSFNLVAGLYYRLLITAPGERPVPYTVATPFELEGEALDLVEMISVGRYGWGPPGNMPMPGWGFGPGWY